MPDHRRPYSQRATTNPSPRCAILPEGRERLQIPPAALVHRLVKLHGADASCGLERSMAKDRCGGSEWTIEYRGR